MKKPIPSIILILIVIQLSGCCFTYVGMGAGAIADKLLVKEISADSLSVADALEVGIYIEVTLHSGHEYNGVITYIENGRYMRLKLYDALGPIYPLKAVRINWSIIRSLKKRMTPYLWERIGMAMGLAVDLIIFYNHMKRFPIPSYGTNTQ